VLFRSATGTFTTAYKLASLLTAIAAFLAMALPSPATERHQT